MYSSPKNNIGRNKGYLDYIRSLPCEICGNPQVDAHHIRRHYFGAAMGKKPYDYCTIALCREHHDPDWEKKLWVERIIIRNMMEYIDIEIYQNSTYR